MIRRLAPLLALTIAACGTATPGAGGEVRVEAPDYPVTTLVVHGTAAPDKPTKAELQDLTRSAEQSGEKLETLLRKYRGYTTFQALVSQLATDQPELYVSAGYVDDGPADVWLRLTREPDRPLLDRIRATPYDVEVQYGTPLGSAALVKIKERMFGVVGDFPGIRGGSAGVDPRDDSIRIRYAIEEGATVDEAELRDAALQAGGGAGNIPVDVVFVNDPASVREPLGGSRPDRTTPAVLRSDDNPVGRS
ncbi:hypothetical protein GT755_20965 [Herbidospora sp. NEAU-GS84]|uniref:Uncharacterized protein n=1 Tax=Herbidospora solisilvae TaxID=2696284 RepID=A0A7C9NJG8_9ACTN|nr:hypothetical protein [Herbidospora solisilvae]NAS24152.1 hypothetical protein [Herbidospora solisilvae]